MAFVPPAVMGITTLLSAGAGILQGVSAIRQGYYQAAVAKNNAVVAERNAALESERSQREGMRSDREYAALLGEQLATQGASGFDILGRSQMATRDVTRRVRGEAATDIRAEGVGAARRLLQDAANFRAEGRSAKTQGWITGISSFMQAGSEIASSAGWTTSLASSRRGGRRPWDNRPNWYMNRGRG